LTFFLSGYLAHRAQLAMQRAGTNILPTRPALALVTTGPFERTRNPLYLAAIGVYLGVALWVDGLAPLILLPVVWILLDWGVVRPEERYLAATFGGAYVAYCARVRRWL
jgi:protein-S-isoprenylcysteine O-methyltransferase Ste14